MRNSGIQVDKDVGPTYNFPFEEIKKGEISAYSYIYENIDELMDSYDVDGLIQIARYSFEHKYMDAFECHSIAHEIGHHAAELDHFTHIDTHAISDNVNFCGGGFIHGVEAGIAELGGLKVAQKMLYFCKLIKPIATEYRGCYHGAGHEFMEQSKNNPYNALLLCDKLIEEEDISLEFCYRGVFSEHLSILHLQGAENSSLLEFCASLSSRFHRLCGLEINSFGLNTTSPESELNDGLVSCIENGYGSEIKEACVASVSWTIVDNYLANEKPVKVFPQAKNFEGEMMSIYIRETVNRLKRHINDGAAVDVGEFCDSLNGERVQECKALAPV